MQKAFSFIIISLFAFSSQLHASVWYVKQSATGANTGTSWVDAFTSFQDALNMAITNDEIWVASGTYLPSNTTTRSATFNLISGVKFYGGFNGTESSILQRDWINNITTLSGDIGAPGIFSDNCYHVVSGYNLSSQTTLDGFHIANGNANSTSSGNGYGGGFTNSDGSMSIRNCNFHGNSASVSGGGIFQSGISSITIQDCIFSNNNSDKGGGLYSAAGSMSILRCSFSDNGADLGAAIFISSGSFSLKESNVSENLATNGAVYTTTGTTLIDRVIFSGNSGGVYNYNNTLFEMYNCLVAGNTSTASGIVNTSFGGNTTANKIVNCTFASNKYLGVSSVAPVVSLDTQSTIANCIFWGNDFPNESIGAKIRSTNYQGSYSTLASAINITNWAPNFINPGIPFNAPFNTNAYDFHLQTTSATIDIGDNSLLPSPINLDLDSTARIHNSMIDLGCYENAYCMFTDTIITSTGLTQFCTGDTLILYTSSGLPALWNTGANADSIIVIATGFYHFKSFDASGCISRDSISVISLPSPNPGISFNGDTLFSNASGIIYQWYLNGILIPGATSSYFLPTQNGNYVVNVTNSSGCFNTSPTYTLVNLAIKNLNEQLEMNVYPTLISNGKLMVIMNSKLPVSYSILSINGGLISRGAFEKNRNELDVTNLASGVYILSINSSRSMQQIKFVVQKQ